MALRRKGKAAEIRPVVFESNELVTVAKSTGLSPVEVTVQRSVTTGVESYDNTPNVYWREKFPRSRGQSYALRLAFLLWHAAQAQSTAPHS